MALDPAARALFGEWLAALGALLQTGFLPAAPRKEACERCGYRVVCGPYEEERVAARFALADLYDRSSNKPATPAPR